MENFSIKIDENVRLRLYKICRLCGDDNPNNTDILANSKKSTNVDPDFHKKIFDCVGIQVTKGDKMPQTACNACREKINDFFEFREMCLATDIQTRRLLGLTETIVPKLDPVPDALEDDKTEVEKTIKKKTPTATKAVNSAKTLNSTKSVKSSKVVKVEKKAPPDIKKPVKVEREKPMSKVKKKVQIVPEPPVEVKKKLKVEPEKNLKSKKRKASGDLLTEKTPNKRERLRETIIRKFKNPNIALDEAATNVTCTICNKPYLNAGELHRHLDTDHLPRVVSYHCVRCNESIEKKQDVKDHNLWHKLSKTPFECGRCGKAIMSLSVYTKHILNCSVFVQDFEYKTKKCATCNEEFETQNLYNWHKCVISQLKCEVCQMKFTKRATMLRHVVRCSAIGLSTSLPVVDSALEPEPDPLPEPEPEQGVEDHFADAASNDEDGSDTEMNLKPNLEIDIEVPAKERSVGAKRPTPFVVIPHGVTNTENSRQDLNSGSNSSASTPVSSNSASSQGGDDDSISVSSSVASSTPTPMVRIKLEPRVNRSESSKDSNGNTTNSEVLPRPGSIPSNISVRIKAEIIDSEYRGLFNPEISSNIKKEREPEAVEQSSQPEASEPAEVMSDPLGVPDTEEVSSPKPASKPAAKPALKLVIKKQHGTLNSSFVDGTDISRDVGEPEAKKRKKKKSKIFKIPKALALRIKQERCNEASESNDAEKDATAVVETTDSLPVISEVCSKSPETKKRKNEKVNINSLGPAISIKQERLDSDDESMSASAVPAVNEVVHKPGDVNTVNINHVNIIKQERMDDEEYGLNCPTKNSRQVDESRKSSSKVATPIGSNPRKANNRKGKVRRVNPLNSSILIKQERIENYECESDMSRTSEDPLLLTNEADQLHSKSQHVDVSSEMRGKVAQVNTLNSTITIKQERLDPGECDSNVEISSTITESPGVGNLPVISEVCSKSAESAGPSNVNEIPPNPIISIKVEREISQEAAPSAMFPIISSVCSNSNIEMRADGNRTDVNPLNPTIFIKQEPLENNECETEEATLSIEPETTSNVTLPVISQVCSKSSESSVQSMNRDMEHANSLDPAITIKQERVDVNEQDDVTSEELASGSNTPLPVISQVCSQSTYTNEERNADVNEMDVNRTVSIKQECFDNDEYELEANPSEVNIRSEACEVVPVISEVFSREVNKPTTSPILSVRVKTERLYEDEEKEDSNGEVQEANMESSIRIKEEPDCNARVLEQNAILPEVGCDTPNTEGHSIDRSRNENLATSTDTVNNVFALKISLVSSGKDALAEINCGERTTTKKDIPPVGKGEPRKFPILRIRSEFNAFNFSDDNNKDPPAAPCSGIANEIPPLSVQIKREPDMEVSTGVGADSDIPIKEEPLDYDFSIKSEPYFEGEEFGGGTSDADILFHNSLGDMQSEPVNNFVISNVESITRVGNPANDLNSKEDETENLANDSNPKEDETELLVPMEQRNFDDRDSPPCQELDEEQSPDPNDDEQNNSAEDEAQQYVVCKEEPRYESENEADYISDSQSVANEDDLMNESIEENLDEIASRGDALRESTCEMASSTKNIAGFCENVGGIDLRSGVECTTISLDRTHLESECVDKTFSLGCEQETIATVRTQVDSLTDEQVENSEQEGSHTVSPINSLCIKAVFNEIKSKSDDELQKSNDAKNASLSLEMNPSSNEEYPVENVITEKKVGIDETNARKSGEMELEQRNATLDKIEPAPTPSKDEYSFCTAAETTVSLRLQDTNDCQSGSCNPPTNLASDEAIDLTLANIEARQNQITSRSTENMSGDDIDARRNQVTSGSTENMSADDIEARQNQITSRSTENMDHDRLNDFHDQANFDENIEEGNSNCNQKLKDLIKDNDNLLGFFENELSRNCDFPTEEASPMKSSEIGKTTDSTSSRTDSSCKKPMPSESEDAKIQNESTHETDALPLENYCTSDVHNVSNEIAVVNDMKQQPHYQNYVSEAIGKFEDTKAPTTDNSTGSDCTSGPDCTPQQSTASSNMYETANLSMVPPCLQTASPGNLTTNDTANNVIGSAVPLSAAPAIISLPKAIVSPTVSCSAHSYTASLSNLPNSPFFDPSTSTMPAFKLYNIKPSMAPIVGCSADPSVMPSISSLNSNNVTPPNYSNVIASVSSPNPNVAMPIEPLASVPSNERPGVSLSNPPGTHLSMLHINEIAENNNNANIERELQNDLDSISSNSNLEVDDGTVASLSEMSESGASTSVNDKNNTA
ncbi:uncharacterized protein LOC119657362 isoform X2 [Hermetia illucens]|nr:uncharacterized protein LOC119657362 isoform X2 [Hermetia illucens]